MVAGQELRRDGAALPDLWAGVLRVFEQPVPVALVRIALLVGEDARHHAADAVRDGHRGYLPAREDEVAEGYLLIDALLDKALVYALVVAADEHKVVVVAPEALGLGLVEGPALRGHIYDARAPLPGVAEDVAEAALERLRHHDEGPSRRRRGSRRPASAYFP